MNEMTPDLEKRWKAGEKPFDGEIVTSSVDSSMETLLQVMNIFIENVVDPSEQLFIYHDWHENNGSITNSKKINVDELRSKIEDEAALKRSTHGDLDVRTAVYSNSNNWLLRWCIDLDDNAYCDFEFCASKSFGIEALARMEQINPDELYRTQAKSFFDRIYGG